MMAFGGRRSCTRSIQVPDRSVSASRLASVANHSVSKRPIWLLEAAARSNPLTAKDRSHRRIVREPLGVIDIFVAGEPPKHRLASRFRDGPFVRFIDQDGEAAGPASAPNAAWGRCGSSSCNMRATR
jgi:hypothetical protein